MKKQEYLDKLELELRRQNIVKIQEILADYEEHFAMGLSKGKSEEEICNKLGEPTIIAKAYQAENLIQQIQDAPVQDQFGYFIKALLRIIILTPLNFLMLIGPVLILVLVIISMWSVVLSLGGAGFGIAFKVFSVLPPTALGFWGTGMTFFGCISALSMGLLGTFIMFYITAFILKTFVNYLRWNIDFVKGTAK